ncbi:MAG: LCP family protein [Herbiconiux sp.]|nr:LCP family protein [Herbiconiux sp.]
MTRAPIRHGRQRTGSAAAFVLRSLGIAVAVLAVSAIVVVSYAVTSITQTFSQNAVDLGGETPAAPPPFLGAFEGGFNMLIAGTDNDANQGEEFGERDATLNDVNILLHVSADHTNAVVVSFPRDLVIPHPECTDPETGETFDAMSAQPLNEAYSRGGLACVAATITNLTGVPIQYGAATSFNGVIEMTNAVGGVEVCAADDIADPDSGSYLTAGLHTVQGQEALAFLRNRHGVGDGSDLSRIGSQQQYLSSLLRKIRSESTLSDPTKLYGLAQAAAQNITPSTSLQSADSMVSLALTLKDVDLSQVVFVQYPTEAYVEDANKVQPTYELADALFERVLTDQPVNLAADSTVEGSTVVPTDGAAPTEAPVEPVDPEVPATDSAATPDVIEGLKGQTAAEQTCAQAFSG